MLASDMKILTLKNLTAKVQMQQPHINKNDSQQQYNNDGDSRNSTPEMKYSRCNGSANINNNVNSNNKTRTPQRAQKFNNNNNSAANNKHNKKQQQQYYNIPTTTGTLNRKKFYHHLPNHFNNNGRNKNNNHIHNTHNNSKAVKNEDIATNSVNLLFDATAGSAVAAQTLQQDGDGNNNITHRNANNEKPLHEYACCNKTNVDSNFLHSSETAASNVNGDLLKSPTYTANSNYNKSHNNRNCCRLIAESTRPEVNNNNRTKRFSDSSTTSINSNSSLYSASSCSLTGSCGDLSRELIVVKNKQNNYSSKNKKTYWKAFNTAGNTNNNNSNSLVYFNNHSAERKRCTLPRQQQQQLLPQSKYRQLETTVTGAVWPASPRTVVVQGNQKNQPSTNLTGKLPHSVSNKNSDDNNNNEYTADGSTANKAAMTTALAAGTVTATAATTTANASTTTATATTATSTTSETATKSVTATADVVPPTPSTSTPAKTTAINVSAAAGTSTEATITSVSSSSSNSSPSTLTTSPNISTAPTSGTSSPNSYTLDFLHSVGVKMTGGANLTVPKTSMANMRSTATYSNHSAGASPARNAYNFPNVTAQRTHNAQRFSGGGNGGSGGNGNGGSSVGGQSHGHHYSQQHHHNHHHQHHHHHQPQQLTIASFMQKELLNDNFVGTSNRAGNNGSSGAGGGMCSNTDYVSQQAYHQQQRYHSYYQPHYQPTQQQPPPSPTQHGYTSLQHSYHSALSGEGVARIVGGGGGGANVNTQRQHLYQNYHSNSSQSMNAMPHQHSRHQQLNPHQQESSSNLHGHSHSGNNSNVQHSKQTQQLSSAKKSNYTSSSASSCSSSSSSSSSVSSVSSQTSTSYRHQRVKSTTHLNLVIETLPAKSNVSSVHRSSHRLQHGHHHNTGNQHQNNIQQNHHQQHGAAGGTPTTPQLHHQNIFNLTYVNTDASLNSMPPPPTVAIPRTTESGACSPSPMPSSSCTPSPQPDNMPLLLGYDTHNQYHQQHHQNFVNNKKFLAPLPLSISTPTSSPLPPGTTVFCQQITEAVSVTTTSSSASVSTDSGHPSTPTPSAATSSGDYDDSDCSSTHSAVLSQQQTQHKYQKLKPVALSGSSSASSTSSVTASNNCIIVQQPNTTAPMQQLHSPSPNPPLEFGYNQHYQQTQQQHIPSPQPPQHQQTHYRSNGVISLLNLPLNNNYSDEDLNALKQQSQAAAQQHIHQHFYFTSGEHLNSATLPAGVGNGSYWSPLQHSNFLYSQAATGTNMLASPSCSTVATTAPLSPRLQERDEQAQHPSSSSPCNNNTNTAETQLLPLSHLKRSPSQTIGNASLAQQSHQSRLAQSGSASTSSSAVATVAALRTRNRGQQQVQVHHQQLTVPPPPPPVAHAYQQHNLLYGSAQPHLRPSTPSSHDFFAHTPPDRFLARAHLIEAKEAPASLLNNSKWDNLSQGIWSKFTSSQQTEETFKQKMRLWRYLYIIIKNAYPRYGLYLVGSTISGFGADTSDVDMCLVSRSTSNIDPRMEALFNLTVLRDCLSKSAEFENFNLIEAKVPILRFRDRIHQLEVDLNFNNCVGIKNTHLLYCYSQLDWRLRPLVLVTKLWAQYHNINNAKNMTISSYSLVLMVIHFLQYAVSPAVLPCLHDMFPEKFPLLRSNDFGYVDMTETIGPYESKNTQPLGELFLYFLEYYSCFDYTQFAISIRTGGLLPINVCRQAKSLKNDIHQWKELCIEEPFDLTNTARSVYDYETFERVKAVFVASWRILQETLDLNSIFAPIIIPPPSASTPALGMSNATAQQQYEDIGTAATGDATNKQATAISISSTLTAAEVNAVSNATNTTIPSTTFSSAPDSITPINHSEKSNHGRSVSIK